MWEGVILGFISQGGQALVKLTSGSRGPDGIVVLLFLGKAIPARVYTLAGHHVREGRDRLCIYDINSISTRTQSSWSGRAVVEGGFQIELQQEFSNSG